MLENVNHPSHYNRENAMECIEEMELVFGREAVKHFCLCNVWKYRYRAADKNGAEDLAKSDFYMNKYKELCEKENKDTLILPTTNPWITAPIEPAIKMYNSPYDVKWEPTCSNVKND